MVCGCLFCCIAVPQLQNEVFIRGPVLFQPGAAAPNIARQHSVDVHTGQPDVKVIQNQPAYRQSFSDPSGAMRSPSFTGGGRTTPRPSVSTHQQQHQQFAQTTFNPMMMQSEPEAMSSPVRTGRPSYMEDVKNAAPVHEQMMY